MAEGHLRWYILFRTYEQGLALHDLLDRHDLKNRIAPAPRAIQGKLSCGMSLLLEPDVLEAAKQCIERNNADYHDIVPLEGQLKAHRDKYC